MFVICKQFSAALNLPGGITDSGGYSSFTLRALAIRPDAKFTVKFCVEVSWVARYLLAFLDLFVKLRFTQSVRGFNSTTSLHDTLERMTTLKASSWLRSSALRRTDGFEEKRRRMKGSKLGRNFSGHLCRGEASLRT